MLRSDSRTISSLTMFNGVLLALCIVFSGIQNVFGYGIVPDLSQRTSVVPGPHSDIADTVANLLTMLSDVNNRLQLMERSHKDCNTQITAMKTEIKDVKTENRQLKENINVITDFLRAKGLDLYEALSKHKPQVIETHINGKDLKNPSFHLNAPGNATRQSDAQSVAYKRLRRVQPLTKQPSFYEGFVVSKYKIYHDYSFQKREREIQQKLEEKEESAVEMQDTYNSMQQEVEIKTKKLKKLFAKLQSTKAEIMDLQEEHSKERQELEQTQMELTRDLKLKMLIIENFIPVEDKTKVMNRAVYDEDEDMWKLKPLANKNTQTMAKRPTSALGNRRPVSEYARVAAAMGGNPRFKGENILMVELDMPNRTTRDYDGPQVAPRIQAALDAALQDEADIEIEGQTPSVFSSKAKIRRNVKSARPKTGKRDASKEFPSSRGLVPK
ncbi:kinesin-II 95 kDa subunit-like [Argopecten irradians]|uniref:kinesin-II 95 kDa subunit-like n=1 Tax=Argopecten irradians TaxID=31199 RepID=UPI0037242D45